MPLNFIDRKEELSFLENQHSAKGASFVIIYGRRRVGKTELINQFIKSKPSFYYLSKRQDMTLELNRFKEKFSESQNIHLRSPQNFEELFTEIIEKINPDKKFIIAIDEFTYWIEKDKTIISTFQVLWNELISKKNVMLILSGSIVSLMETEVLGYKSPLYGRRTGQWNVHPLNFTAIKEFLPKYSIEDLIKTYSCTNGIPMYLQQFSHDLSFKDNINETFFKKGNILYEEGVFLLMKELREVDTYLNIVLAISQGSTKLSEIASKSGIDVTNILKYIKILMRLGIIKKITPVTHRKEKTRNTIIKVSDKFFRFWTMFVYPYKAEIERGIINFSSFDITFKKYIGETFEEISEEILIELNKRSELPFSFTKIGKEWGKIPDEKKSREVYEIDIAALNEETKEILFSECKWQDKVNATKILKELKEKARYVQWNNERRKEYYIIFARSFKEKFKDPDVLLFDLKDIENVIKKHQSD